jgi:hypothetical protein
LKPDQGTSSVPEGSPCWQDRSTRPPKRKKFSTNKFIQNFGVRKVEKKIKENPQGYI